MMFRLDDQVEAREDLRTDDGDIRKGERFAVAQTSVSGGFVRFHGGQVFARAGAFRLVGRPAEFTGFAG